MATDALVSFVVEELCSIAKDRLSSLFEVKNEVEELKSTFLDIQAVLEDAESHRVMDERVQGWLWELKEVAYEVEDILDEWVTDALVLQEDKDETHHPKKMRFSFPSLLQSCKQVTLQYDIGKRIREITKRLSEISIKKNRFNLRVLNTREVRLAPNKEERETGSLIDESVIFGRDDIKQSIIEQLLSEEKSVSIVSIVGMGGLGKTTLAQLIYNDGRVTAHFGKNRIWVCVSDPFDVKSIAIKVIESMDGSTSNNPDLDTLQRNLREAIDKKRFLLVLDDVWDETGTQWEKLRVPLMGAAPGSKILVTTRSGEVGKAMKTHHSHDLGVLSDPDCWKLFKSIAFEGAEDKDGQELIATGERILKRCKGVPLAVKSVGSLLRRRREKWYWDHILKSEIWEWEIDGILPALFLSYYDLPPYLKRCFSFCSVFPKDYPMEKIELVQLWMAHGLIKSKKAKEDVTEEIGGMYYDSLLTRSLFQDAQKDIDGNVFVCKMHDLVHDLATYVSSHDYCSREAGDPELSSIKCHHLSLLVSDATSFIQSPLCSAERLRTLLLYGSATCKEVPERFFTPLKFLRALGLRRTKIENLLSSLGKLKHLRFLDLSELNIIELPEVVSDLCNLQTLNLNRCKRLSLLPSGISKMVKLRHLEINKTYDLTVLPNGIGKLTSLRALCKFPVGDENGGCKIGELKELNLLKGNFEIKNLERVINENDAREAELHKKSDLHGLSLCCNNKSDEEWRTLEDDEMERMDSVLEGLRPPHSNLKGLKIINYAGSKFPSWLEDSKFSSLVRVVLVNCRKCMLLPEGLGQLKALQTLHIENCEILSSLPEGLGQLKALQTLKIWGCKRLSSLFDGFEQLKSLSRLDIWDCPQLRPLPNLQHLTALERLSIQKCPLLTERLEKEKGEDWCKISHIPRISIDEEDYAYDEYLLRWMFPQMDIAETKVYFPEMDIEEMKMYYLQLQASGIPSLITRARIILEAIFPSSAPGERCVTGTLQSASLMDNIWAEQRRLEALKLYYRVLEAMCKAEHRILHGGNLTSLLNNERFHRCMLACSAELVLATHKTVTMLFPAVLERTGITAFDLSKVIESFVRHEETLPRELKQHLNSLEERLLESMAWEKGSSLYNSLIIARPALSAEINRLGLLAEPMPSLDAIAMHHNISTAGLPPLPLPKHEISPDRNGDVRSPKRVCSEYRNVLVERNSFTSPVKDRLLGLSNLKSKLPPIQSAFASPARPNPAGGGETCAEAGIHVFFTKIARLAANRIKDLCERLQLSLQVRENVYRLMQQILSLQTALFFNRHIDQLILCSFYGVAKISQLSLTFKEIIYNYRKQPLCKPQVFRSVFVDWPTTSRNGVNGKKGQEHVDIITFYNEIFIPAVKPLLVELGPGSTHRNHGVSEDNSSVNGQSPGSPRVSHFPNLPDMSPKKVSASHNVYVSPLRSSKMDALISSSSKSYYACVGESTHAYQSPSKDLTAINNRLNSRKVGSRLNFDDIGLVSDSIVARSLYPQSGSSASSSGVGPLIAPVKCEQSDP